MVRKFSKIFIYFTSHLSTEKFSAKISENFLKHEKPRFLGGSRFWSILDPFWAPFWGPFGARFLAETQGKQRVFALFGAPKGLHFGPLFGPILGPHLGPFLMEILEISWKSMENHGNLEEIKGNPGNPGKLAKIFQRHLSTEEFSRKTFENFH